MSWRGWLTLVLLAAAIASGWAVWNARDARGPDLAAGGRADYVLEEFELIALDETGSEAFTLRAPRLSRDPAAKTLDIATPLFLIPPTEGARSGVWEVRSQTGWVSAEGDELRLRGQVRAESTDANGRPLMMATEQLNVFPDTKRATSAVAVTVTQPGLILNGRGLDAQLDTRRVILNDVKARYERTAR